MRGDVSPTEGSCSRGDLEGLTGTSRSLLRYVVLYGEIQSIWVSRQASVGREKELVVRRVWVAILCVAVAEVGHQLCKQRASPSKSVGAGERHSTRTRRETPTCTPPPRPPPTQAPPDQSTTRLRAWEIALDSLIAPIATSPPRSPRQSNTSPHTASCSRRGRPHPSIHCLP